MALGIEYAIDFANDRQSLEQLRWRADFRGKSHARLPLRALRADADHIDFFTQEDIGNVTQQTLPVASQYENIDRKHRFRCRLAPCSLDNALRRPGAQCHKI